MFGNMFGNKEKRQISSILNSFNKKFKSTLTSTDGLTPKDILNFLIYLMQIVEKYNINGTEKKEMVIKIIKNIISEHKNDIKNFDYIENFIKKTLPSLIDTIVLLDRKDLHIKL